MRYKAVAFDLDGTLYHDFYLYRRLVLFVLKEQRLLRAMNNARHILRKTGAYKGDFYEAQAQLMGEVLGEPKDAVKEKTERLIYRGWEPYFKDVKVFPHVKETLGILQKAGVKLGLLSDFPPETKLINMKIDHYFDTIVCSEEVGRLKPDPLPFMELASRMKAEPEDILYVGNIVRYDVEGAARAGMKSALVCPLWKKTFFAAGKRSGADFCFSDYRKLSEYVLA